MLPQRFDSSKETFVILFRIEVDLTTARERRWFSAGISPQNLNAVSSTRLLGPTVWSQPLGFGQVMPNDTDDEHDARQ
jgi:hypothetical protein